MRTQDHMANNTDYVELGLACADVCKALDQAMDEETGRPQSARARSDKSIDDVG